MKRNRIRESERDPAEISTRSETPPYSVVSKPLPPRAPYNPAPLNYPALPAPPPYPPGVSQGPPEYEFISSGPRNVSAERLPATPPAFHPTPSPPLPELPPKLRELPAKASRTTSDSSDQDYVLPDGVPPELPPKPTPPSRSSSLKRSTRSINSLSSRSRPGNQSGAGSEAPLLGATQSSTSLTDQATRSVSLPGIAGLHTGTNSSANSLESFATEERTQLIRGVPANTSTPDRDPDKLSELPVSCSGKQKCQQGSLLNAYSAHTINKQGSGMYGRHYRAFRDSRRPERAGGIVYLKFNQQDFYELLDECDAKRRPFNDRSFPPDISSLCYIPFRNISKSFAIGSSEIVAASEGRARNPSGRQRISSSSTTDNISPKMGQIVWRRPKELNPRSRLLSGGKMFRGDLYEGMRGSPNFGAAASALALKHELLFQVMPDDQCPIAFEDDWGIYKFRFWRYGNWTEVTIDDKLPSVGGELLYTHTQDNDEHWMSIMEKAYAKFNGCYDIISKIPLSEMLQHLTGGVTETIELNSRKGVDEVGEGEDLGGLAGYLEACFKKRAIILVTAKQTKEGMMLGLESDLPYIVTRAKRATRSTPALICLYSPFGAASWAGAWGNGSPEWRNLSHDDVFNQDLISESEFDFWISLDDLCMFFERVFISHQASDSLGTVHLTFDPSITNMTRCGVYGRWDREKTDGGAPNNAKFLTHNAQYLITQSSDEDRVCVLSLVQRFRPRNTPHEGFMCIGFTVFRAPENIQYRMTDIKDSPVAIATYAYDESVSRKLVLEPGNYVVIPTTYQAGVVGEYLLRCFSASHLNIRALKTAPPSVTKKQVVDVELICAENLPDRSHSYDAEPCQGVYCVVMCGKEKCRVPLKHGANPTWNSLVTFHAKQPYKKNIKLQVWYTPISGSELQKEADICIAESCNLPVLTGDHRVVSQLMFSGDPKRGTTVRSKKRTRCAGTIVLIIRYNPLPTIFRGLPRQGASNVQVKLISNPPAAAVAPPSSKTNGIDRHPTSKKADSSAIPSKKTDPCPPTTTHVPAAVASSSSTSSTPRTSASLARLNQPRRTSAGKNTAVIPSSRTGIVDTISSLSISRHLHDSLDDVLSEKELRFAVNADKTLSPERPPLGSSDGTLSFDGSRSLPPPYTSRAESTRPFLGEEEEEGELSDARDAGEEVEEELVTESLPQLSPPPRPPRSDLPA